MVYAPERPTELEPQLDRPDGRSFFMASQLFHLDYGDLFLAPEVIVMQSKEDQYTTTLLLDTADSYRWQLTTADPTSRQTTELKVDPAGNLSGWIANYNAQGTATKITPLDDDNWRGAARTITSMLSSPEMSDFTAKAQCDREKHTSELAIFALTHKLGGLTLHKAAYEKVFKSFRERSKKLGFSAMKLHAQPN